MKSLKNKLLTGLLGVNLLTNMLFAQSVEKNYPKKSESTKFAIVFVGSEAYKKNGTAIHPIDENCFLVNGVKTYNALRKYGIKKEDIYFMYPYQGANFSDTLIKDISKEVEEKFNEGGENSCNISSRDNLKKKLREIVKKLDKEDTLIISLQGHGDTLGFLNCDKGGFPPLHAVDFNGSLTYNSLENGKVINKVLKNEILIVTSICYSNKFLDNFTIPGIFIGASTNASGWIDRGMDFNVYYFEALTDKRSDLDSNEIISYKEAFDVASKKYKEIGESKMEFIKGEYLNSLRLKVKDQKELDKLEKKLFQTSFETYFKKNK